MRNNYKGFRGRMVFLIKNAIASNSVHGEAFATICSNDIGK